MYNITYFEYFQVYLQTLAFCLCWLPRQILLFIQLLKPKWCDATVFLDLTRLSVRKVLFKLNHWFWFHRELIERNLNSLAYLNTIFCPLIFAMTGSIGVLSSIKTSIRNKLSSLPYPPVRQSGNCLSKKCTLVKYIFSRIEVWMYQDNGTGKHFCQ